MGSFCLPIILLVFAYAAGAEENARPRALAAPTGGNAVENGEQAVVTLGPPRNGIQRAVLDEVEGNKIGTQLSVDDATNVQSPGDLPAYDDNFIELKEEHPLFIPRPYRNESKAEKKTTQTTTALPPTTRSIGRTLAPVNLVTEPPSIDARTQPIVQQRPQPQPTFHQPPPPPPVQPQPAPQPVPQPAPRPQPQPVFTQRPPSQFVQTPPTVAPQPQPQPTTQPPIQFVGRQPQPFIPAQQRPPPQTDFRAPSGQPAPAVFPPPQPRPNPPAPVRIQRPVITTPIPRTRPPAPATHRHPHQIATTTRRPQTVHFRTRNPNAVTARLVPKFTRRPAFPQTPATFAPVVPRVQPAPQPQPIRPRPQPPHSPPRFVINQQQPIRQEIPRTPTIADIRTGVCRSSIFYISSPLQAVSRLTFTHFAIAVSVDQCARTCHEFNCAIAHYDPTNGHCQFNPSTAFAVREGQCPRWPATHYKNNVVATEAIRIFCVQCHRPFRRGRNRTPGGRFRTRFLQPQFTGRLPSSLKHSAFARAHAARQLSQPTILGSSTSIGLQGQIFRQPQSIMVDIGHSRGESGLIKKFELRKSATEVSDESSPSATKIGAPRAIAAYNSQAKNSAQLASASKFTRELSLESRSREIEFQ